MNFDPPPNPLNLNSYLFGEERRFVTGDFREYLIRKRFNFIATLNSFPDISDLYFATDENWIEALRNLETITNREWIAPTQLTIVCFRELRVAAELLLFLLHYAGIHAPENRNGGFHARANNLARTRDGESLVFPR
jgi:hypothetical protein